MRMILWLSVVVMSTAGLGSVRGADTRARFRMVILRQSWSSMALGYQHEAAWGKLRVAPLGDALATITSGDIDSYDWQTQALRLTVEASRQIVAALPKAAGREAGAQALMALEERLGWGNPVERALYTRPFVVLLGDEPMYGGIFLDPPSQMGIDYPVARCTIERGHVVFHLLPMQLPFFDVDPGASESAPTSDLVTRNHGPVSEVPPAMLDSFRKLAVSPHARAMRALIQDPRIREDLLGAGKLTGPKE